MRLLVQSVGERVRHQFDKPWGAAPRQSKLVVIGEQKNRGGVDLFGVGDAVEFLGDLQGNGNGQKPDVPPAVLAADERAQRWDRVASSGRVLGASSARFGVWRRVRWFMALLVGSRCGFQRLVFVDCIDGTARFAPDEFHPVHETDASRSA